MDRKTHPWLLSVMLRVYLPALTHRNRRPPDWEREIQNAFHPFFTVKSLKEQGRPAWLQTGIPEIVT
ncbi:hypothetical protein ACE40V_24070, partial [Salmonella enterica]|uniref:hypothetical protein n=1 Tax=Salmonella enterica TaxID=28901 RepID=UPI003D2E8EBF